MKAEANRLCLGGSVPNLEFQGHEPVADAGLNTVVVIVLLARRPRQASWRGFLRCYPSALPHKNACPVLDVLLRLPRSIKCPNNLEGGFDS